MILTHNDDISIYPSELVEMARAPKHFGRMNDPISSAWIKGPCGDEMEFYLFIKKDKVVEIKFYTEGCISTRVCGSVTASLALGKTIYDVLGISPKEVMSVLPGVPESHLHCSILAVSTLYKAVAEYLLKP